jgi:sigma-B regulation protein RsbU (phosphoserine phosphatase)
LVIDYLQLMSAPGNARDGRQNEVSAISRGVKALARELSLARDIQMGMVRRADPWFPGQRRFEIAASMEPAKLVGGDFYDAFLLDDDHLVVALGDVAGKGISAALFMVRALTLLRSHAQRWQSLAATVAGVNDALAADNEAAMFLRLFMGVLDLREGTLDYVNPGHAPPLLRAPDGRVALHPVKPGIVRGMMEGARGAAGTLRLPPGGTLMLYSDGVTEAEDPAQAQLGEAAMLAAAAAIAAPEARSLIEGLAAAVAAHAGTAEQADDITMLAVRWLG